MRWSNDSQLTGAREKALADYIVHKGLASRGLRDEILVQLCNQAWKNDNPEKVWQLMAHCLAAFQPGPALSKLVLHNTVIDIIFMLNIFLYLNVFPLRYLLKFVSDHAPQQYRSILQHRILRSLGGSTGSTDSSPAPPPRRYPPTSLEWKSAQRRSGASLSMLLPDGSSTAVAVDPWTTCEEAAALAVSAFGIDQDSGWTVTLDDNGIATGFLFHLFY